MSRRKRRASIQEDHGRQIGIELARRCPRSTGLSRGVHGLSISPKPGSSSAAGSSPRALGHRCSGRDRRSTGCLSTVKLPNRQKAEIAPAKVRLYLLSSSHPQGRVKASAFLRLGYTAEHWERLTADLLELARHGEAERTSSTYGEKFRIVGRLHGPNGRSSVILSIWFLNHGDSIPRFVTAYPAR